MLTLESKIETLTRVGASSAKKLNRLGIKTAGDLLYAFPFRYDDFTKLTPIAQIRAGEPAHTVGRIELIQNKRSHRRRMYVTEALLTDGGETVKVIWFNQPFIAKNLKVGDRVSIAGKVEEDFAGPFFSSPNYERLSGGQPIHTQGFVPNYHLTEGLTQKQFRFLIKQAIGLAPALRDILPEPIRKKYRLDGISRAIEKIHFPKNRKEAEEARRRIAFDELLILQLGSQLVRQELEAAKALKISFNEASTKSLVESLPFKLTDDQRKAAWQILKDMEQGRPMSRLLEGDVGSGKTLVAALAMYNTALNGHQAVLLAPTEILAGQHFNTVSRLLANTEVKIGLVTRTDKRFKIYDLRFKNEAKGKKKVSAQDITEAADIVIGTHALIQERIQFNDLALAVIDEQHRFGVEQRKTLIKKAGGGLTPHFLSMTATPIPRSLALALYGDLDVSIIKELPAGRKKILTRAVPEEKRQAAYNFIREQIAAGRQAFVICPLIDPSDVLGVKSVKEEFEKLDKRIFPDLSIGLMHGKLNAAEKERIMRDFLENKIKILVSTSVIEVGVDVPNASIMMIEGAERFGLAQLHQFRGRVGRSEHQSYCFLFTDSEGEKSRERLKALENHYDGFELAKMDLELRGAGEVYGTAQSGFPDLKVASLFDYELMKEAREAAEELLSEDHKLKKWPELLQLARPKAEAAHLE